MDSLSFSTVLAPLVGIASKHIVNYLKSASWFDLLKKSDGKPRKHLIVFATVSILSLLVAFLTGSLTEDALTSILLMFVNIAAGHGTAVTIHELSTDDNAGDGAA